MSHTKLLQGKTIVVTGCASGIGLETARLCKAWGATVLGVDRTMTQQHVDELYKVDLSCPRQIHQLIQALPHGVHGLANIAGLPPTAPAELVLKVNLVGLKALTTGLVPKMADGASIVNLASLAGFDWANRISSIHESEHLDFDEVAEFVRTHDAGNAGGRSYFFSKEALVAWTLKNRWSWREDARRPCRGGHARDGPPGHARRHRARGGLPAERRQRLDPWRQPAGGWGHVVPPAVQHPRPVSG